MLYIYKNNVTLTNILFTYLCISAWLQWALVLELLLFRIQPTINNLNRFECFIFCFTVCSLSCQENSHCTHSLRPHTEDIHVWWTQSSRLSLAMYVHLSRPKQSVQGRRPLHWIVQVETLPGECSRRSSVCLSVSIKSLDTQSSVFKGTLLLNRHFLTSLVRHINHSWCFYLPVNWFIESYIYFWRLRSLSVWLHVVCL